MSKSLLQFAQLMRASNEQLFDRYINVRLTSERSKPKVDNTFTPKPRTDFTVVGDTIITAKPRNPMDVIDDIISDEQSKVRSFFSNRRVEGFQLVTPKTGCKPNITVSGKFIPAEAVCSITLTIYNMLANIDTMLYNWCEIEAGYLNSGVHITFIGQITNCYMAKPNPNGELVISVVNASVTSLYNVGKFAVEFNKDEVTTAELIKTCIDAIKNDKRHEGLIDSATVAENSVSVYNAIPAFWKTKVFMVGKTIRYFRSALECISWLNSLFASYPYSTGYAQSTGMAPMDDTENLSRVGLCPLMLGFDLQGNLQITSTFSEANPMSVKALKAIGSAVLTSTFSATITAPFNPDIKPGDVIAVDSKYFKTRLNTEAVRSGYASLGSLWYVVSMEFTFSTYTTNTMTLILNNLNNKIRAAGG